MLQKQLINQLKTSVRRLQSLSLIAMAIGVVGSVPMVAADTYDDQINAIRSQNAAASAAIGGLQSEAATYQSIISQLAGQIATLQAELASNQAKQADTVQRIADNEALINLKKGQLGADVTAMYVDGTVTTIEELAGSTDISEYIDKQEYRTAVQNQLNSKISEITTLQAKLQQDKLGLDQLIKNQADQQAQLAYSRSQQSELLSYNESQQNQYVAQVNSNNASIRSLQAQQRAAYARAFGGGTNSSVNGTIVYRNLTGQVYCGGGYPSYLCDAPQDSFFDSWGEYNRECVSYAAWYESAQGHYVPTFGNYRGQARGNANQWHGVLAESGAADIIPGGSVISSSSVVGTVVYMPIGGVGHVGVVLGTSSEGEGWVRVGQYNINVNGRYSEMDLKITPNLEFYQFH
ncbi:MAG: CHAP domain-containing protein [Candidatus Saccharimonadales bacterium]